MTTTESIVNTNVDEMSSTVNLNDLDNLTDEELYERLQRLEQEKEHLAQQQLLKEIGKLQHELQIHEKQRLLKQYAPDNTTYPGVDISNQNNEQQTFDKLAVTETIIQNPDDIEEVPIEELAERLEELKRQRDELSNKKLLDEIDALQEDIRRLQIDTDYKETRMIAQDAVAIYALSPTEIELRWDRSEFGEVESYTVFYKPVDSKEEYLSIPLLSDSSFCVIPNLTGNTTYHIKMEAAGTDNSEIKTDVVEVTTYRPVQGFVLIMAVYEGFQLKALKDLHGVSKDTDDLRSFFESINYEVVVEENLTGEQMINCIKNYRHKLDEPNIEYFILILCGYKYHGYLFGVDGGLLITTLIDYLKYDPVTDSKEACYKQRLVFIDTVKVKEETVEELDVSYQPRSVRIRYTDLASIEVSFRPPKLSEEPVMHFVVALSGTEKSKLKTLDMSSSKDNYSTEFNKLRRDAEYRLEIFAAFKNSNGAAVNATIKTRSKESNRPKGFGVELISQSQIYVFWKPASLESQENTFYRIYLEETGVGDCYETTSTYSCHVFDNLKQNTLYKIRVTSVKRENNNLEESDPVQITISTPKDGTPIIMADSTTSYIQGEPNFLIVTASGAFVSDDSPSFLRCLKQHLEEKYNRYDICSIIQDVRNELIYTSERYDIPVLSSTLYKSIFLGGDQRHQTRTSDKEE